MREAERREAERRVQEEGKLLADGAEPLVATDVLMIDAKDGVPALARNMVVPVLVIVVTVFVGLYVSPATAALSLVTDRRRCSGRSSQVFSLPA